MVGGSCRSSPTNMQRRDLASSSGTSTDGSVACAASSTTMAPKGVCLSAWGLRRAALFSVVKTTCALPIREASNFSRSARSPSLVYTRSDSHARRCSSPDSCHHLSAHWISAPKRSTACGICSKCTQGAPAGGVSGRFHDAFFFVWSWNSSMPGSFESLTSQPRGSGMTSCSRLRSERSLATSLWSACRLARTLLSRSCTWLVGTARSAFTRKSRSISCRMSPTRSAAPTRMTPQGS
mmetsp:Transcript_59624/g.184907  ORF Transcript_59624/g.184907 Transcript_59624/m.184907 type:complete len:237 (+) Transcript_59624:883-1593(+)